MAIVSKRAKAEGMPIIHIGYPKTASTWFQKAFYPHLKSPRYIGRGAIKAALADWNALDFEPEKFRKTLGLGEHEPGLISEEGLCGYLHNGGVGGMVSKVLAEQMKAAYPDARIVIFIRSQPSILVAAYAQYVRSGGTRSARRYFFPQDYLIGPNASTYKQPRFDIAFFRYSRLIELYERLFGAGNVHLFLYEQFATGGVEFLRDYSKRLALDVEWDKVSVERKHASYSHSLMQVARATNLLTARSVQDKTSVVHVPGWYDARRQLLESANRTGLFGRSPALDQLVGKPTADWLRDYYVEDNKRLSKTHKLPLAAFDYPMEVVGAPDRPTPGRWRSVLRF
jgi:hypothetical protein